MINDSNFLFDTFFGIKANEMKISILTTVNFPRLNLVIHLAVSSMLIEACILPQNAFLSIVILK